MKKIIAVILSLTMSAALCACSENNDTRYKNAVPGAGNILTSSAETESGSALSSPDTEAVTTTTTTAHTTVTEPETTTQQTTTSPIETTTTTTTEPPQLLPTVSGSGTTMNNSVIINATGDPNTGVITLDIENNSDGTILFGPPSLVVDGYSVALDNYAIMTFMSSEVPSNAKGLIELKVQPEQIKGDMRITGEVFSKKLGYHPDRNFDITLD